MTCKQSIDDMSSSAWPADDMWTTCLGADNIQMQMRCEQCPDAICRENHQYKLSRK